MPFASFGLHPDLLRGIKEQAFTRPTPIQAEAIPPALLGRDLLACASTGSGKTAAFMLPTMHHLLTQVRPVKREVDAAGATGSTGAGKTGGGFAGGPGHQRNATRVLVLTPTRELAAQIHEHIGALAEFTALTAFPIFGGVSMVPQERAFRTGVDILVATPGRLLDHLKRPYAKLTNLEILILDEADRMLDMGFLPDIRRILGYLPTKRQTLFFSATMPPPIRQLTGEMLKNPVTIQLERTATPAIGIAQAVYPVPQHLKSSLLKQLLQDEELESVICFTRTKHRANRLAEYLERGKISCTAIHGNRSQAQRTAALAGFKSGRYRVLVATDIAARGIDITAVSHVINFDCPHIPEDYIHRVGRTGRASATGDAFTFVAQDEEHNLRSIERAISKRLPRITLPEFDYNQKPTEKLEVPLADRLATMRNQKAAARVNRERKLAGGAGGAGAGGGGFQRKHQAPGAFGKGPQAVRPVQEGSPTPPPVATPPAAHAPTHPPKTPHTTGTKPPAFEKRPGGPASGQGHKSNTGNRFGNAQRKPGLPGHGQARPYGKSEGGGQNGPGAGGGHGGGGKGKPQGPRKPRAW